MKNNNQKAYFAGGCFWGVEYYFHKLKGVVSTKVGYMGGTIDHPTYEQVNTGETGHIETLEVVFKPEEVSFEELAKTFFEIHDFTQVDRQGPDFGTQYASAIFCISNKQLKVAKDLVKILEERRHKVATKIIKVDSFFPAEDYHQKYYEKINEKPYCHIRKKIF